MKKVGAHVQRFSRLQSAGKEEACRGQTQKKAAADSETFSALYCKKVMRVTGLSSQKEHS